jgi:hypothetical protein
VETSIALALFRHHHMPVAGAVNLHFHHADWSEASGLLSPSPPTNIASQLSAVIALRRPPRDSRNAVSAGTRRGVPGGVALHHWLHEAGWVSPGVAEASIVPLETKSIQHIKHLA